MQGRTFQCEPCRQIIVFFKVTDQSPYIPTGAERMYPGKESQTRKLTSVGGYFDQFDLLGTFPTPQADAHCLPRKQKRTSAEALDFCRRS